MEDLFTAYFRRNGSANGNRALRVPEDGTYPQSILHEGGIYDLDDADYEAGEAHYNFSGVPAEKPSEEG